MIKFSTLIVLFCFLAGCSDDNSVVEEDVFDLSIEITSPFDIKGDIASSGGNIINEDDHTILRKGVCYSLTAAPTVNDLLIEHEGVATSFEVNLENLEFNTVYYARAFAETTNDIFYSDEVSFTTTNECTLNVFEGDVTLTTQTEVDNFAINNYCSVTGDLRISEGDATADPIVDISGLYNLRSLGSIIVSNTTLIESLEGLHNIDSISNSLAVVGNEQVINIDEFIKIDTPVRSITVFDNANLNSIEGISNIKELVKYEDNLPYLKISDCPLLNSLDPLEGITANDGISGISIHGLPFITNIDALSNISGSIDVLDIFNMTSLQNINGIYSITSVNGRLYLSNNESLNNILGFQSITTLSGFISIFNNDLLYNLDAFENVTQISGELEIVGNASLFDFCGIVDALDENNLDDFSVYQNGFNPTLEDLLNGNCAE
ncbi:hypothetical protein [Cochleicola gelatinilyticus]|uniref:Receptor L-domain domain-containing protein n=1 Tax=Cochleicola gelatinilyticus TaxID=1763537 RepID=A0A167K9N9_9FLAO|nr:hypothetical protein [Cochleicola gelatinilyticus]OAB81535.1 hypothetical protein ULVI_01570 [Cochleicola gelatinilyticus]